MVTDSEVDSRHVPGAVILLAVVFQSQKLFTMTQIHVCELTKKQEKTLIGFDCAVGSLP